MPEITLSLFPKNDDSKAGVLEVLAKFEQEHHCQVQVHWMTWDTGHADLNQIAFQRRGADVSEIGTSWLGDYISMKALRPFAAHEIQRFGGVEAFAPVSWIPGQMDDDVDHYAIPWSIAIFMLFYRRSALEKAGIAEARAFESIDSLEQTVEALARAGHPMPVAPSVALDRYVMLHSLAPFVWNEGGQFRSDDGQKVLFNSPEALRGMARYFNLARSLAPEALEQLNSGYSINLFASETAAITFSSCSEIYNPALSRADQIGTWGLAPTPPGSFVGGQSLVIWQHTRHDPLAVELVQYLTSHPVQLQQSLFNGHLPARISGLQSIEFAQPNLHDPLFQALNTGRTYRPMRLWSVMEDRLVQALSSVWDSFYTDPQQDVYPLLEETLNPLARRLQLTLSQ